MKYLLLVLLLFPASSFAQNTTIDSLKRVIETTKIDSVKGRTLCRLCDELRRAGDYESAAGLALEGVAISRSAGNIECEAECLNCAGTSHMFRQDVLKAVAYFNESLALYQKLGQRKGIAGCLINLGTTYMRQGKYELALQKLKEGSRIAKEVNAMRYYWNGTNSIGIVHLRRGDYVDALDYFLQAYAISEKMENKELAATTLGSIGTVYLLTEQYDKALEYISKSIKASKELGREADLCGGYINTGSIYLKMKEYEKAIEYFSSGIEICKKTNQIPFLLNGLSNLAAVYAYQDKNIEALEIFQQILEVSRQTKDRSREASTLSNIGAVLHDLGNYSEASKHATLGLKIAIELDEMYAIHTAAITKYRADSALGDWKEAFWAHQYYAASADSLKNDEQSQELGRLEARFESEKEIAQRDLEITKLEADRLRKDLNIKEQRSKYLEDSLTNAEQKAILEANGLRLAQQVKERDQQRQRDSLENASRLERFERERVERQAEISRQRLLLGSSAVGLLLVLAIAYTLFQSRKKEQRANAALRALNEEIQQQKTEIEAINTELQATLLEVNAQKHEIEEQHAKIEDSIRYASRIQHAILPSEIQLADNLPAHFIHYQPRDIVSGDFYWMTKHEDKTFFATVDCTGHGVPGAFMSVLGSNLLHQIVDENQITEPDIILAELDRRIAATLRQQFGGDSKDGMDLALIVLHAADANGQRIVEFAGAGRPLWHWSNGEITEYKSAKYSCGGSQHEDKTYPAYRVQAQSGDRLYIFSDGPVDQFGGPKGRKLGSVQLQAFLTETAGLPIDAQGKRFGAFFNDWMKAKKQLDDVLIAGVAV